MNEVVDAPASSQPVTAPISYALDTGEKFVNETFAGSIRR